MTRYLGPAGRVFGKRNNDGRHRRQRVVAGELLGYAKEYIGNLLYYIGASLIRARRNRFRKIRRTAVRLFKGIWKVLKKIFSLLWGWICSVVADLINPFIKGVKSVKGYHDLMAEIKDAPNRVKLNRTRAFFRYGFRWNGHLIERFMSRVLPVVCLVICFFVIRNVAELPYAVKVTVGGQDIGYIEKESVYDEAVATIKRRIIKVDDSDWRPSAVLSIAVADSGELNTQDVVANKILSASGMDVTEATGIYIGGQFYGATTAGQLLSATVDGIIEPYQQQAAAMGDDVSVRFTKTVDLVSGIYPASSVVSYETLSGLLTSEEEYPIYYSAADGEKVSDIAKANGLTVTELEEMNPEVDLNDEQIHTDTQLLVAESDSLMSVKTVRIKTTVSSIGFDTVTTTTSRYNLGYYSISQQGSNGERTTVTEVEYKNGRVVKSTVIEEKVTKQPVDMHVTIGIGGSAAPNQYGGSIGWPTGPIQKISRGWIPGVHRGIDIACVQGTAVYAALSGKVVVSEDTAVGYGRYIIIDHGNGMQTLYGHMLARFAYVGDYVSRGQIIGQVGSTGNSTGPHLHFEVRINDERVPTEPYLGLS